MCALLIFISSRKRSCDFPRDSSQLVSPYLWLNGEIVKIRAASIEILIKYFAVISQLK